MKFLIKVIMIFSTICICNTAIYACPDDSSRNNYPPDTDAPPFNIEI